MELVWEWQAMTELYDARDYYDAQKPGLGDEFGEEVDKALKQIEDAPLRWPEITKRSRYYKLKRFPYAIIYQIIRRHIHLLAVAHLRRDQLYWKYRERSNNGDDGA